MYSASELYREVLAQLHGGSGGGADSVVTTELSIDGAPEEEQLGTGVASDSDSDENDDNDGGADEAAAEGNSGVLSAVARAKRARTLQKRRQQQRDAHGERVRFEGDSALNFLGFVKALDNFVATTVTRSSRVVEQRKRVVYLVLDDADKLLDRGLAPLLTCIFTINEQLAYLNVRLCV